MKKLLPAFVAIVCCLLIAFTTYAANSSEQVLPCDTLVCDDWDACTTDSCANVGNGTCIFTPVDCDDNDLCTFDEPCDLGCHYAWLYCDDSNECTVDECNSTSTGCDRFPLICDDADPCTNDICDTVTGCVFQPIPGCTSLCDTLVCDDGDLCTTDTCDNVRGCAFTQILCDDADLCTTDSCTAGVCSYVHIPGCTNPCDSLVCNDNDACTLDTCTNGACFYILLFDCDDGFACTADACIGGNCVSQIIPGCSSWCSAYFSLYSDGIPHQYLVWNGAAASTPYSYLWSWGDGTTDTSAYPVHTYSDTGNYTICLTITAMDGCTDSLCQSYSLMKDGAGTMISVQVVDSLPTAIHEAVLHNVQLYPNPTNGSITLKAPFATNAQAITLRLFDSLGKLVWQQPAESAALNNGLVIDLGNYSEGIYFLHLQSANGTRVMKVVRY